MQEPSISVCNWVEWRDGNRLATRELEVVSIYFVYVLTTTATTNHNAATRGLPM